MYSCENLIKSKGTLLEKGKTEKIKNLRNGKRYHKEGYIWMQCIKRNIHIWVSSKNITKKFPASNGSRTIGAIGALVMSFGYELPLWASALGFANELRLWPSAPAIFDIKKILRWKINYCAKLKFMNCFLFSIKRQFWNILYMNCF